MKPIALLLIVSMLSGCATIHRHPKATALIVATAVGTAAGYKLGHQKPCPSVINGVPYNGTPPCPSYCDSLGHCDWPGAKK